MGLEKFFSGVLILLFICAVYGDLAGDLTASGISSNIQVEVEVEVDIRFGFPLFGVIIIEFKFVIIRRVFEPVEEFIFLLSTSLFSDSLLMS